MIENFDNNNNNLLRDYMALQTFIHLLLNIINKYTKYINKEQVKKVRSFLKW